MKVLVTGGTGFLGKVLVLKIMEQKDWTVRLLVRDTRKVSDLDPSRIEVVRGNMRDEGCLQVAVKGVDLVFHLATTMNGTWNDYFQETVVGTERLIRAALQEKVRRFVYVSSIGVLEVSRSHNTLDEDTPYETEYLDPYVRSKILAEGVVRRYFLESKLDAVIIRPGVIFGPGGNILLPRIGFRFSSIFVLIGWRDVLIPTVFVENVAEALILASEKGKPGEIYHIVDDERVSKFQYIRMLKMHWNRKMRTFRIPYFLARLLHLSTKWLSKWHWIFRKIHNLLSMMHLINCSRTNHYTNLKIKDALGWRQSIPTQEALEKTIRTYSNQ